MCIICGIGGGGGGTIPELLMRIIGEERPGAVPPVELPSPAEESTPARAVPPPVDGVLTAGAGGGVGTAAPLPPPLPVALADP